MCEERQDVGFPGYEVLAQTVQHTQPHCFVGPTVPDLLATEDEPNTIIDGRSRFSRKGSPQSSK